MTVEIGENADMRMKETTGKKEQKRTRTPKKVG